MRAEIDYDLSTQRVLIYLGDPGTALFQDNGVTKWVELKPGDERPVFLSLDKAIYDAIADAVLLREAPRNADPALLREMLDDARDVRDRLLTMLEQS